MIIELFASLLLGLAPLPADTVIQVRPGDRVEVQNLSGRILVETWDRDEVSTDVQGRSERAGARARRLSWGVVVGGGGDDDRRATHHLRVPGWMAVTVRGRDLDVEVRGVGAELSVRTIEGSVTVADVRGRVQATTVEGDVVIDGARGDVEATSGDGHVRVRGVEGNVLVRTVDGDVVLREIDGARVEATTVDGDVTFEGRLRGSGVYRLVTHDGDITVLPLGAVDAAVSVSTFDGEFLSEIPVTLDRIRRGEEFEFTLGSGSARLVLQAFDGSIRLLQPAGR